jgi:hypothetical protein
VCKNVFYLENVLQTLATSHQLYLLWQLAVWNDLGYSFKTMSIIYQARYF